jgi:purine-nucleoside phosphorylase
MPARLKPTAPLAADAILVGDPGRALLLAQELLEKPKMSNHARGLWGYSGRTGDGDELTIQATGMGGPSAAMVLADLAELGVKRAVRVGTCAALDPELRPGALLIATAALASAGSAISFGIGAGETVSPDPDLQERLVAALGDGTGAVIVASFDSMPATARATGDARVADMQTLALLARGGSLGIAVAAVLIVSEGARGEELADEDLESAAGRAGRAAAAALSNPQLEG